MKLQLTGTVVNVDNSNGEGTPFIEIHTERNGDFYLDLKADEVPEFTVGRKVSVTVEGM